MSAITEPEQTSYIDQRVDVRDLKHGDLVDQAFLVQSVESKTTGAGKPYLVFMLSDKTGAIESVAWDDVERLSQVTPGLVVRAQGHVEVHEKFGARVILNETDKKLHFRIAKEEEYDIDHLVVGPSSSVPKLCQRLDDLIRRVEDETLSSVLQAVFNDDETYEAFIAAPAALKYHQAYKHGLLEHTVTVAEGVDAMTETFPGDIDPELALTGALLHDVGKIHVYGLDGYTVTMTLKGTLLGELPLTFHLLADVIDDLPEDLDQRKLIELLHIVCSHHGKVEHGASVPPATRSAALVHFVDNLGGRLGSFDRVERSTPGTEEFSSWDKGLGGRMWMGQPESTEE